jgi:hypothetical protein
MKGYLNNYGKIVWSAPGAMGVSARSVFYNHEGATFEIKNDQLLEFHEDDGYAPWQFINKGTVAKTAGTGTSTIDHYTLFVNHGLLQVKTGTLFFDGEYFAAVKGSSLVSGIYQIEGTLKLQNGPITTNDATVWLDGPSAQIMTKTGTDALANFTLNGPGGTMRLLNGKQHSVPTDFENRGYVWLGANSQLAVNGNFTQTDGRTLIEDGTLAATLVRVQKGSLYGYGTISGNMTNAALVHVGTDDTTGILTIEGDYNQTAAGTLHVRLGGTSPGSEHDQLQVTGAATLAGALAGQMIGGYAPLAGDGYQVVLGEDVTGTFSKARGPAQLLDIVYDPISVTLQVPSDARVASRLATMLGRTSRR